MWDQRCVHRPENNTDIYKWWSEKDLKKKGTALRLVDYGVNMGGEPAHNQA